MELELLPIMITACDADSNCGGDGPDLNGRKVDCKTDRCNHATGLVAARFHEKKRCKVVVL